MFTSSIRGLVVDEQGAAIPGAAVRIVDSATGNAQTAATNESGRYVIVSIVPGVYGVTIAKAGFATFRIDAQKIEIGAALTVSTILKVSATATTVEIASAPVAPLRTSSAAVGSTLTAEALARFPNFGRDAATLAVFQPGTAPGGQTAGASSDQNVFVLDGGNNSDDMAGNNSSYVTNFTGTGGVQNGASPSGVLSTPVESIEEFKVSTFNQGAGFFSSIGAQIQMVTKRGTNQYHGSLYGYYYGTNVGAANSWVNNHTPADVDGVSYPYTPLPSNHRNRFGGTFGGILTPKILGGKTYAFVNYEGSRFPNVSTYTRAVPSELLRAGVIQIPDATGKYQPYNLNPAPVTVNGVTYSPANCGSGLCDPRGIGLNPIVKELWEKYLPPANEFINTGDHYNTQGFLSSIRAPLTQDTYAVRIDHDVNSRHRFFATYRHMTLTNLTTNMVDIGGALPGTTFGTPAAVAPRVQKPSYWVIGLSSTLSRAATNDLRFNYTRNFWRWGSASYAPPPLTLGGTLEIGGEATSPTLGGGTAALIPYNVNSQSVRQRFWNGQDKMIKDDVAWLRGKHVIQFGGIYARKFDIHSRSDNGQGINNAIIYQSTASNINFNGFVYPSSVPAAQQPAFNAFYSYVLGFVSQSQVAYTRSGPDLTLSKVGDPVIAQSVIPSYDLYLSDTWHVKPSVTFTYSLGYNLEMPPYEPDGKQVSLVDSDSKPVVAADYFAAREKAALAGQVYQPVLGFATTDHIKGRKYPYDPFYGGLAPRVSVAWSPNYSGGLLGVLFGKNKTVIRGGYGRIYGRLNGVNLVLVPLSPPGLLQAVSCVGVSRFGQCAGANEVDPNTAFRIGVDGKSAPLPPVSQTLPQPYYPGISDSAGASDVNWLDPKYRPQQTDNVTVTIQRQVSRSMTVEAGYAGRIIRHEMAARNLDAVPYMTTLDGQSFADAYSNVYFPVAATTGALPASYTLTAQPFFEAALGGASGAYCTGYANCTSAVAVKNTAAIRNTAVSELWTALYRAPGWALGRSMISAPLTPGGNSQGYTYIATDASGYGNYNALFVSYRIRDFHGVSGISNFTWGRALGTGTTPQATSSNTVLDVFHMENNYGEQSFDIKFLYNAGLFYTPKWFRSGKGLAGHVLGGWTLSPLFTVQSGAPLTVTYSEGGCTGCQAFGEVSTTSSATASFTTNAQGTSPYTGGYSVTYNNPGINGAGSNNPSGVNLFSDPAAVLAEFRKCVLGFDQRCGGYAIRNLPRWNLDLAVSKSIGFWRERAGADLSVQVTNVMNHAAMGTPNRTITSPSTFGTITTTASISRQLEFGIRIHF